MKQLALALILSFLLTSCAVEPIYYWGNYEDLLYDSYQKSDAATPGRQIEKMEADIQKANGRGLPLPPGFHAHLGYLYFQSGNAAEAKKNFEVEKMRFPASIALMDRFLKKLKKT